MKTIIDEYDAPLEAAFNEGFYKKMLNFILSLFGSALKGNPYLERGILMGRLRFCSESAITGFNNFQTQSLLDNYYKDCFGFTEVEVKAMLDSYGIADRFPLVKGWYGGYHFGTSVIYNPWSISNYIDNANGEDFMPKDYWSGLLREVS